MTYGLILSLYRIRERIKSDVFKNLKVNPLSFMERNGNSMDYKNSSDQALSVCPSNCPGTVTLGGHCSYRFAPNNILYGFVLQTLLNSDPVFTLAAGGGKPHFPISIAYSGGHYAEQLKGAATPDPPGAQAAYAVGIALAKLDYITADVLKNLLEKTNFTPATMTSPELEKYFRPTDNILFYPNLLFGMFQATSLMEERVLSGSKYPVLKYMSDCKGSCSPCTLPIDNVTNDFSKTDWNLGDGKYLKPDGSM